MIGIEYWRPDKMEGQHRAPTGKPRTSTKGKSSWPSPWWKSCDVLQFAMLKVLKLEARAFKQLECPVPKTGEPFSEPEQCDTKLGSLA